MWRWLSRVNSSSSAVPGASCRSSSTAAADWLRSTVAGTRAGEHLLERFDSFKRRRRDDGRRRVTNAQLRRLNRKIDKLLSRLDDVDYVKANATTDDENECVVCLSAAATMLTFPCAHRVTCRRCFVRTIQTAITERNLPLRCVVCRARILTLNEPPSTDDTVQSVPEASVTAARVDRCPKTTSRELEHSTSTRNADGDDDVQQEVAVIKKHPRQHKQSSDDLGSLAAANNF